MKALVQKTLSLFGYNLARIRATTADMDEGFEPLYQRVSPFTMTSPAGAYALYKSVEYLINNDIRGDFVECGVWRGGSSMLMALSVMAMSSEPRIIHMFDTFDGMTAPGAEDFNTKTKETAISAMSKARGNKNAEIVAYSPLDHVQHNIQSTGYDIKNIRFVEGKVEDTVPKYDIGDIALLRLDTDWYQSTRCEMEHLYPKLASGGILIIDDYGSWAGARKAVDEYIAARGLRLLLHRIDTGVRAAIKP